MTKRTVTIVVGVIVVAVVTMLSTRVAIEEVDPAFLAAYPMVVSPSPDGSRLLVKYRDVDGFRLGLVRTGENEVSVIDKRNESQISLTWEPAGRAILFQEWERGEDGGGHYIVREVTDTGIARTLSWPPSKSALPPLRFESDSTQLAMAVVSDDLGGLYVGPIVGDAPPKKIQSISEPSSHIRDYVWVPESRRMLAVLTDDGEPSILVVDVDSDRIVERMALPSLSRVGDLTFSLKGDIVYLSALSESREYQGVFAVDLKSKVLAPLATPLFDVSKPSALSDGSIIVQGNQRGAFSIYKVDAAKGLRRISAESDSVRLSNVTFDRRTIFAFHVSSERPPVTLKREVDGEWSSVFAPSSAIATELPVRISAEELLIGPSNAVFPAFLWKVSAHRQLHRIVVAVHGGPYLQSLPEWDETYQFLLSRDSAVLDVNYPGSSGYGLPFAHAGAAQMTTAIGDAVAYARGLGYTDDRITVYGHSFGATLVLKSIEQIGPIGRLVLVNPINLAQELEAAPLLPNATVFFVGGRDAVAPAHQTTQWIAHNYRAPYKGETPAVIIKQDEGHYFHRLTSRIQVAAQLAQGGR